MKNLVLINHMYSGDYLKDGNIGHEIVNLFKDDNNRHYIYQMSGGDYQTDKAGQIKIILLVRNVDADTAEVLAKAEVEEDIFGNMISEYEKQNKIRYKEFPGLKRIESYLANPNNKKQIEFHKCLHQKQLEYIRANNITFSHARVDNILSTNSIYKEYELFLTFKVKNFRLPNKQIFISSKVNDVENGYYIINNKDRMCGAAVATYEELESNDIQSLLNADCWENEDTSVFVDCNTIETQSNFNILNIIRKCNDEITFSNWISYYLKNDKSLLSSFIQEKLKVTPNLEKVDVIRESIDNIDIYIEDKGSIFVLENKIKSSINGTKKYDDNETREQKEFSQLKKYYVKATSEAISKNKTAYFYLLLPDYAYKDTSKLEVYENFQDYNIIRYSELYKFFKTHNCELPYYQDFVKALSYHGQKYCNDLFSDMLSKFVSKIRLLNI